MTDDISEYCGGYSGECEGCPFEATCSEKERGEKALEEEMIGGGEDATN